MRGESKPDVVLLVAITGDMCSGVSVFARQLHEALGVHFSRLICEDQYYQDQADADFPSCIDFKSLFQHLVNLQAGKCIVTADGKKIWPAEIIIIEGHFLLTYPPIVNLYTEIVFLSASAKPPHPLATYRIDDRATFQWVLEDLVDKLGIDSQATLT